MAEDQQPVEPGVGKVGDDNGRNDGSRAAQGLQALAEHDEEEKRQHPGREPEGVGGSDGHHLGRLAREGQHRRRGQKHGDRRHRQDGGQDDAALDPAGDCRRVPRPDGLGHHRVEHHQGAHPEHADAEEVEVAQCHRGEGDG